MRPVHHALPWPTIDADELTRASGDLRRVAATIAYAVRGWRFRPIDWHGRSATAHSGELDLIRERAASIPDAAWTAAEAIHRLEQVVRSAQDEIRQLADSVRTAESVAASRRAAADRAARTATDSPVLDPASIAETERLRQRALECRHRAEQAQREAGVVLRRAITAASRIVERVDHQDRLLSGQLDSLLQAPLRPWIERPEYRSPASLGAGDRAWVIDRINATTTAIQRHVEALAQAVAELEAVPWSERTWSESLALVHLREELELHQRFLAPGRRMLDWDPAGDGRVIEVFGDLTAAEHIAVVVPGIMNTIENFDDHLARNARDLWSEAAARDGRTAVIAWLGYDTPELLNAVSKGRAVEFESDLRSFVDSLPTDAHVTVVAHSYGTVLTGEAASRGLAADDVVLVGSPGTRLDHATDAELEPGAQVFAGVSDSDYVVGRTGYGSIVCPEKALGIGWLTGLRWVVSPITGPLAWKTESCKTDADGDVRGLSHGINPAHEDFGAVEISTEGVDGHSSYFAPDSSSLIDIARVVTGTHPEQR